MKYFILAIIPVLLAALYFRGLFLEKKRRREIYDLFIKDYGKKRKKEYPNGKAHLDGILKRFSPKAGIDDITWNDLDMEEVFARIDRTKSAAGEEYLYYLLHNTGTGKDGKEFDELISNIENNDGALGDISMSLYRLGYSKKRSPFDHLDSLTSGKGRFPLIHFIFDFLYIPAIALIFIRPLSPLIGAGLVFALLVYNIFSYFRYRAGFDGMLESLGFLIRLSTEAIYIKNKAFSFLENENTKLDELYSFLKSVKGKGRYLSVSGRSSNSTGSPLDIVLNYINMILHIDIIQYQLLLGKMSGKKDDIIWLIMLFGKLDSAISVGDFRKSLDEYCRPEFTDSDSSAGKVSLSIKDGFHPLLEKHVDNTIETRKSILLTGSNASGKSTFLRMIAVNAILAQSVYTVCAKSYSAPVYKIYSSIALRDDLLGGESYFIVEIRSLKRIIDELNKDVPVLCFVDEVLRGTNTVERISASSVILRYISENNALCFAATHDGELTEMVGNLYTNYHFSESIEGGDVNFDYILREGRAETRNAIKLLESFGYPADITEGARKEAVKLDSK